jgi:hypothetical protein
MMFLPFVGFGAATACALAGRRTEAICVWALSLAITLAVFAMHATDSLSLSF